MGDLSSSVQLGTVSEDVQVNGDGYTASWQHASRTAIPQTFSADVLVVGGGLGGVAAALAALRRRRRVFMTEEYEWLGGQLTSQAVPPDEHCWVEQFGVTRSYRAL